MSRPGSPLRASSPSSAVRAASPVRAASLTASGRMHPTVSYTPPAASYTTAPVQGILSPRPHGDEVLVNATGRTYGIPKQHARTILDLQGELRNVLNLRDQKFEFLDVNGQLLLDDRHLQRAISSGLMPLQANLAGGSLLSGSVDFQREELGQMQWKLMREQLSSTGGQIAALARQFNDLQHQTANSIRQVQSQIALMREEIYKAMEQEAKATKEDMRILADGMDARRAISGHTSPRSGDHSSVQEKHLHGVIDMVDSERNARRQDMNMHMDIMQELRSNLDAEKKKREILEDKLRDLQVRENHVAKLEDQIQSLIRANGDNEAFLADNRARVLEIEERCNSLQNSVAVSKSRSASVERLGERHERVAQTLVRISDSKNPHQLQGVVSTVQELNIALKEVENEFRDIILQERQFREDQISRTYKSLLSEQNRQIIDVEKRMDKALESEALERERSVQILLDEMSHVVKDGKNRDYISGPYSPRRFGDRSLSRERSRPSLRALTEGIDGGHVIRSISGPGQMVLSPRGVSPGVSLTLPPNGTLPTTAVVPTLGGQRPTSLQLPARPGGPMLRVMPASAQAPSPQPRGVRPGTVKGTSSIQNLVPPGDPVVRV